MKRRKWDSKTKAGIVLEGLSGRSVSELCSEYEISQNQYYLWRDKFLQDSHKAFTSYNNPKGNADTERMMRTLKEELLWLREWSGAEQVRRALDAWIEEYNRSYLHSALGYRPPNQAEEEYKTGHNSLLKIA